MAMRLPNQILWGAVAGLLMAGAAYYALAGKRSALAALDAENRALQAQVDKGRLLKASYEKLREEVGRQDRRIEALVKVMSSDAEVGDLPYRIKKLADDAGIDQVAFALKPERRDAYYTEKPVEFEFRASFPAFGQFTSLVSGHERMLNISNIEMNRRTDARAIYAATVKCTISTFVYNPEGATPEPPRRPPPAPRLPHAEEN